MCPVFLIPSSCMSYSMLRTVLLCFILLQSCKISGLEDEILDWQWDRIFMCVNSAQALLSSVLALLGKAPLVPMVPFPHCVSPFFVYKQYGPLKSQAGSDRVFLHIAIFTWRELVRSSLEIYKFEFEMQLNSLTLRSLRRHLWVLCV